MARAYKWGMAPKEIGCTNPVADEMLRNAKGETWSDTNLTDTKFHNRKGNYEFTKLVCTCGSDHFKVAITGSYQTSARCIQCLKWYIVHTG